VLLGCVVTGFVAFGFGEDAKKGRVAVGDPLAECEAADKDRDSSKDGVEEIEGAYCGDAHQVKQRALYPQIGEGLMQALEDAVGSDFRLWFSHKPPVVERLDIRDELAGESG
jgi:hypothetical protein